jgi:hypothetical protein
MSKSFIYRLNLQKYFKLFSENYSPQKEKFFLSIYGLSIFTHALYTIGTIENKEICVEKKYKFNRNGFTEFMIIDKKGNHYNVNNSFWFWKWNSLEDWHKIEINKNIYIKNYGLRIPVFGLFPNIVNIIPKDDDSNEKRSLYSYENTKPKYTNDLFFYFPHLS